MPEVPNLSPAGSSSGHGPCLLAVRRRRLNPVASPDMRRNVTPIHRGNMGCLPGLCRVSPCRACHTARPSSGGCVPLGHRAGSACLVAERLVEQGPGRAQHLAGPVGHPARIGPYRPWSHGFIATPPCGRMPNTLCKVQCGPNDPHQAGLSGSPSPSGHDAWSVPEPSGGTGWFRSSVLRCSRWFAAVLSIGGSS